jgi:hypothetical protein
MSEVAENVLLGADIAVTFSGGVLSNLNDI